MNRTNLTSLSDPKIKQIRALRQRKAREESGLFLVEGIRPVGEAVEAGASLAYLCYAPDQLTSDYAHQLIQAQQANGLPVYAVAEGVFEALADKENPQGIIAVARRPSLTLENLTADSSPWVVALVSPQDPGNIGAILRTVDAVGASALLLLDQSADPYHPRAVRASMGTLFWHPMVMATFAQFVSWAKAHGYHIYGTSAHGSTPYQQVARYERPAALLLGSEREGLSAEQAACCQQLIRLPMRGRATSLNLAVAAGVMLYAMLERFDEAEQGG
jgi:TrmH family RNA methyltransferase